MNFEILDEGGNVINTIVAEQEFVEKHYPERYKLVKFISEPAEISPQEPGEIAVLSKKIDALILTVGKIEKAIAEIALGP